MNNRRSYLDAMNAGRRRRPGTSLEQLSSTLDELESRIRRPHDDRRAPRHARRMPDEAAYGHHDAPQHAGRFSAPPRNDRYVADELSALREELRHQMGAGLRREFSTLRNEIEHALRNSDVDGQAAELGAEFDRLSGMIHKLAEQSDDRQVGLLRLEMEEVKGALGKLAREETVQSFDRRWDEFDRRWSDIASKVSAGHHGGEASDRALQALSARLEQIGDAVNALPTSVTLRSLEDRMKILSATVDQFARQQDRIGPETLDAIEERLNEISRAVAASAAAAHPSTFDPQPFERIEARISSLARQLGEAMGDNPAAALADHLAALSHRVEDLAHRVDVPDHTVARLADQIETISRKLDQAPAAPGLEAVLQGLESRFAALSAMLERRQEDALTHGQSLFGELERRLEDVAARIAGSDGHAPAQDARLLEAMDARLAELASRFENQTAQGGVDPQLIRSLESQIAGLAAHMTRPAAETEGAENILPRLDQIEKSIADGRHDVIETARKAAEEAVRAFSGSASDGAVVAGLADDLRSLDSLTRKSDDRNARTFEAIHDTLLKIVERLGMLETTRAAARDTLAQTPSLAPVEAMPLAQFDRDDASGQSNARPRTPASAAAEAAAEAMRDEAVEACGKRSVLGGLTRALSGVKAKRAEPAPQKPEIEAAAQEETGPAAPAIEIDAPLDPQMANQPLEPGSGAPDLGAIMKRVRDERGQMARGPEAEVARSDFIAAARRAAQAAAAEAETMKRRPAPVSKSKGFSLGRLLGSRRKPVLMGVAAILIALAAFQTGRSFLGGGEVPLPPAPIVEESAAADETLSPPAAMDDEAELAAEQPVRIVGEDAPPSSARSAMAAAPESAQDVTMSWLDAPEAAALPTVEGAETLPAAGEPAEVETLPQPDEEALAAIPVTAGPVALREAAAAGDPRALFEIGNRYAEGRGVPEDMAQAAGWYRQAAEQGLAPAQYRIGNLYEKGVGLERDIAQAKTWYQLAAAQGNASAMHNLAVLHAMGADGVTDNESAARWFVEAAEMGVRDSQYNLGILSAKGVGMEQNLTEAYKWFALVAGAGDKDAAEKRDEVAQALSPEQLENARAAAELWRAKPVEEEANTVEIPESWSEGDEVTASVDMRQAVRSIQQILNGNGYEAGAEDGLMGQRTRNAVAAFQKDNGMEPTGEIDEQLVRALLDRR